MGGEWTLDQGIATFGTRLIYITLVVVAFLWRRADPDRPHHGRAARLHGRHPRHVGAQYLLWFMPFLVGRPTRFAWLAVIRASFWAGYGYIYMTQYRGAE